ncbi:unnamed protein product [Mytilus coruscus]|uniref:Uncharacterized protein n=1 Tax=Mytilus coruscus TaxID=42192 RepID=A0A6J8BKL0_MYTCO|nr:unnamed protein product [Mytilus coruscus]
MPPYNIRCIVEIHLEVFEFFCACKKCHNQYGSVNWIENTIARQIKDNSVRAEAYRRLTGDQSASLTASQTEVDKRISEILDNEDSELICDLRLNNRGQPEKYNDFLSECQNYINKKLELAVDDRRHDKIDKGEISDEIEKTFYGGQVFVGVKETTFQSSSPWRHATEMSKILKNSFLENGEIRKLAEKYPTVEEEVLDSVEPVRILLSNVITRLKWKDKNLKVFDPATEGDIFDFRREILKIDQDIKVTDSTQQDIKKRKLFMSFLNDHCKIAHYMESQHQKKNRPSLSGKPSSEHGLPFSPSSQYAKNVEMVVLCSDCDKPRVLYSKKVVRGVRRTQLVNCLTDIQYTCGFSFDELDLEEETHVLKTVFVRKNITYVCFFCGTDELEPAEAGDEDEANKYYPICTGCKENGKKLVERRTRNKFNPK